jgi:toxin ParE1/3/4
MTHYALSEAADDDIQHILKDSLQRWGVARSERYILAMHTAFENLATFPDIGLDVGYLRIGYLQLPHDSHNVFYQKTADGILIVRVLHQKQRAERHL